MAALLVAEHIRKGYATGSGSHLEVLTGVSLAVQRGEMVAVVGESGTGKSTLLHILGALDRPDKGQVYYDGMNLFEKGDQALARFRNRSIGFVFQFHHLLPEFTALENVAMPALIGGTRPGAARRRARELLDRLGVLDRASHRPNALSGGEQQRIAVARALMNAPDLILADEPTGNLDTRNADMLHQTMQRLCREQGQTFVIVTHNATLAGTCDRLLTLESGQLREMETSRSQP